MTLALPSMEPSRIRSGVASRKAPYDKFASSSMIVTPWPPSFHRQPQTTKVIRMRVSSRSFGEAGDLVG